MEEKDVVFLKEGIEYDENDKESLNWIVNQVKGNRVLAIGFSKEFISKALETKETHVLELDSSTTLDIEHDLNKFQIENINTIDNAPTKFDTILLDSVFEYVTNLDTFFHKVTSFLNTGGRIVLTTSFGINVTKDFKKTFYIYDFIKLQHEPITIKNIAFGGPWIGIVFDKDVDSSSNRVVDQMLIKQLEQAFIQKEHFLITKIQDELSSNTNGIDVYQKFLEEKVAKVKAQNELFEQYKKEKEILQSYKKLKQEYDKVIKDYKKVKYRYDKIRKSFLGKVAFKLWRLLRGKR